MTAKWKNNCICLPSVGVIFFLDPLLELSKAISNGWSIWWSKPKLGRETWKYASNDWSKQATHSGVRRGRDLEMDQFRPLPKRNGPHSETQREWRRRVKERRLRRRVLAATAASGRHGDGEIRRYVPQLLLLPPLLLPWTSPPLLVVFPKLFLSLSHFSSPRRHRQLHDLARPQSPNRALGLFRRALLPMTLGPCSAATVNLCWRSAANVFPAQRSDVVTTLLLASDLTLRTNDLASALHGLILCPKPLLANLQVSFKFDPLVWF
jgi:hypothetical protein